MDLSRLWLQQCLLRLSLRGISADASSKTGVLLEGRTSIKVDEGLWYRSRIFLEVQELAAGFFMIDFMLTLWLHGWPEHGGVT